MLSVSSISFKNIYKEYISEIKPKITIQNPNFAEHVLKNNHYISFDINT